MVRNNYINHNDEIITKVHNLKDYDYILIAKKPGFDLETASDYIIQNKVWDFLSSTTPSYARWLKPGDKVLFYMPEKDQNGKIINTYTYPIFFASAVLDSEYLEEYREFEKVVRLKAVNLIEPPIRVDNPKSNYQIGNGIDKKFIVPR